MSISAKQVMDLRAATGMPMMKCKKALEAEDGDFEKAVERLRKEGLKAADIRADRTTAEGLVRVRIDGDNRRATAVAVSCETDPVSKLDMFAQFVDTLVEHVAEYKPASVDALLEQPWILDKSQTVVEVLKGMIAKIGENMKVEEVADLVLDGPGVVGTYVHFTNKDAAVVVLGSEKDAAALEEFAKVLCMHIVFAKPTALTRDDIDPALQKKERDFALAQIQEDPKMAGKPAEVLERIVDGKMAAFFKQSVLGEQEWAVDPSKKCTVDGMLKEHGATVQAFRRFQIGT